MSTRAIREPTLLQALTPLLFLAVALALAVYLYQDDASYGANQISLLLAACLAGIIGLRNGLTWDDVQQALVQAPGSGKNGRDLGVKHAPFLVLMGAEMPAILIETGFVSNPGEERRLADPKYRAQAARAIFEGIKDYFATANGRSARTAT
jgi:N-acetylmuramoyl-L-alanine amidase